MWVYNQSTGTIFHDGQYVAHGYSGTGQGKNNPGFQTIANVGPIPTGMWEITDVYNFEKFGQYVLYLMPAPKTITFNRKGFLIHGDSLSHPGEASHGCIILALPVRELIWMSGDRELEVISGRSPENVA